MKGFVEPERWQELKRGGADGELNEAQVQEESAAGDDRGRSQQTLEKMPEAER